jgi:transglutaminase-like putative cysteine protease
MQRLAVEGSKEPEVRAAAVEALDRYGAREHNAVASLRAIFNYVKGRIRFVGDPVGTQAVQSPRATLSLGAGNCAQRATLLAALAMAIGIPVRLAFRVIAANPDFPSSFSHVYVVARLGGKSIALDPTYSSNTLGYEYPRHSRMGDFRL